MLLFAVKQERIQWTRQEIVVLIDVSFFIKRSSLKVRHLLSPLSQNKGGHHVIGMDTLNARPSQCNWADAGMPLLSPSGSDAGFVPIQRKVTIQIPTSLVPL